jgi:hydrogenase-4 component B
MDAVNILPIDVAGAIIAFLAGLGLLGLMLQRSPHFIVGVIFPVGALAALALAATGLWALGSASNIAVLPLGLPGLPLHHRLDPALGFFPDSVGWCVVRCVAVRCRLFQDHAG